MKIRVVIILLACALGLLAGCTKGNGDSQEPLAKLAAENAELKQKIEALSASVRSLERRTDEIDMENRSLEHMLILAQEDLRSRLVEMVQQETGGGGRQFMQRTVRPPALPRPYLGFDGETCTPEIAEKLGLAAKTGLVVGEVVQGAPADVGGLRKGDLLQSVNEKPVESRDALGVIFGELKPGQDCQLDVLRGEERVKLTVRVGAR